MTTYNMYIIFESQPNNDLSEKTICFNEEGFDILHVCSRITFGEKMVNRR